MNRNWIIIAVILALVVLGLGYTFYQRAKLSVSPYNPTTVEVSPASPSAAETSPSATVAGVVVKVSATGFSPKEVKIKVGEVVTWMNDDTAMHNVSSAPHPTHTAYSPLNLGNIPAGSKVSLTFPTAGTYKYHDHLNPSLTGSVTVE